MTEGGQADDCCVPGAAVQPAQSASATREGNSMTRISWFSVAIAGSSTCDGFRTKRAKVASVSWPLPAADARVLGATNVDPLGHVAGSAGRQ
jgi:hypothetical protein